MSRTRVSPSALLALALVSTLLTVAVPPAGASSGNHGEATGVGEEESITLGRDYASATLPFCFEVKASKYRIDMDGEFWAEQNSTSVGYAGPATLYYQPTVDYYIAPEGIYSGLWTNPVTGQTECDPATLGGPVTTSVWVEDPTPGDGEGITCPTDTIGQYRRVNSAVTVDWNAACTVSSGGSSATTPTVPHAFDGAFEPATGTVTGTWTYPNTAQDAADHYCPISSSTAVTSATPNDLDSLDGSAALEAFANHHEQVLADPAVQVMADTLLMFDEVVEGERLAGLLEGLDMRAHTFWHAGPPRGAFMSTGVLVEDALDRYRQTHGGAHDGAEPAVFALRVQGVLPGSALAAMEDLVDSVRQIPAGSVVSVPPPGSQHTQPSVVTGEAEGTGDEPVISVAAADAGVQAAAEAAPWAPHTGRIEGRHLSVLAPCTERDREIMHTLEWSDQAIDAFEEDHAYEHDLKLFNDDIFDPPLPSFLPFGTRPACLPHQENDFWANRDHVLFEWTFPDAARPYPDTEVSDSCSVMDLTVGVFTPKQLVHATEYRVVIRASGDGTVAASEFGLTAQMLQIDCPLGLQHQGCVNILSSGGDLELLVGRRPERVMPACYAWAPPDPPSQC